MTRLCDALQIPRGVTAVVGGGGKTTLIERLARELSENARVLCATTTRVWAPKGGAPLLNPTADGLREAFSRVNLVIAGAPAENGKLRAPDAPLEMLVAQADYTLIEADGSRGLPLKAPNEREPVFTGLESLVIAVAGMLGANRPIEIAAHRPECYAALLGKDMSEPATPRDVALVLQSEQGQRKNVRCRFVAALNQCDDNALKRVAWACADELSCGCVLMSLKGEPDWFGTRAAR